MVRKKSKSDDAKARATLALAASILESDVPAARAALSSGADPDAFWIDGKTRLRDFAKQRGAGSATKAIETLFSSEALRIVLPLLEDRSRWTKEFVEYVARRGYSFHGRTTPLASSYGTELKGWATAKAAVRLIEKKWLLLDNATCNDDKSGKRSFWRLWFRGDWKGDRRIVGFWIGFDVDALGWEMVEMFGEATKLGRAADWPDPRDPLASSQKDWEGRHISAPLIDRKFGMEQLVACLKKGGSPFVESRGGLIGEPNDEFGGTTETKAFMDELREAVGGRDGWHLRIAPLLTNSGIKALRDKAAIKLSATKPKALKKSLKNRTDTL